MASKLPAERYEKVKLRTRNGHDITWSCDMHAQQIAFYCKEHSLPVCDRCAIKDHQKPCELDEIEDVILERRRKLEDKQQEIDELKKQLKTLDFIIESIATFSSNYCQSLNDELQVAFEDKIKSVIEKKADEQIRLINEHRQKRIKSCNGEAEEQQLTIKESQAKVESETRAIREVVAKNIKDLKSKNQHAISIVDNIDSTIKRIKQDDKALVNETPQVLASLDDNIRSNVYQYVSDCVDRIHREVQRVKFVEGEVDGKHYGRIDGYIGKWELVKSIHIPSIVSNPRLRNFISDDEICVQDVYDNATYVTNISTKHTQKVIVGHRSMYITSCAPIDSNIIACGKQGAGYTDGSSDGCIILYDRQWKVIRDISAPRNGDFTDGVNVEVDRDGMIIAIQYGQSSIYVINPADGKMVNTITMPGKVVMGDVIQALSSGDIAVKTENNEYTVISRSGEEKAVTHYDGWWKS